MTAPTTTVGMNLATVRECIARAAGRAGRDPGEITLVGVSKTVPIEWIQAGYDAGLRHFGESRVQEAEEKQPKLAGANAAWHLIGHLQTNKAKRAVRLFDRIDSVDSLALAEKLASGASEAGKVLPVLIEVHLSDEETKSGVLEADLTSLAKAMKALSTLELRGLMTVPPFFENAEDVRPYFRKLRALRDELARALDEPSRGSLPVLSMGMSHDFEIAIEEGSTEIRVGSAIFGERLAPPPSKPVDAQVH
jgi:pyridoxal phosphate enzyme (YggS family)